MITLSCDVCGWVLAIHSISYAKNKTTHVSLPSIFFKRHIIEHNKDVGMGLRMTLCRGLYIFLFPFFFMT